MKTEIDDRQMVPLRNMALFSTLAIKVQTRPSHLPGMACFYGPSGYGKTFSAVHGAGLVRAAFVSLGETWTRKTLIAEIATAVGVNPKGSLPEVTRNVEDALVTYGRPLIIDEADYLVSRKMIDFVRGLHDRSGVPIILIGEELLPSKLKEFERAHNRMMDWVAAVPCDFDDTRMLARFYLDGLEIDAELLELLHRASGGRARRIAVNLELLKQHAIAIGCDCLTAAHWSGQTFHTGEPPKRRAA